MEHVLPISKWTHFIKSSTILKKCFSEVADSTVMISYFVKFDFSTFNNRQSALTVASEIEATSI